jgi:hypothetical protein
MIANYTSRAIVSDKLGRALHTLLMTLAVAAAVTGCDMIQQQMGIEDPAAKAAKADAEGKAVGGACRQSGRAIEDCYSIYSWLPKAATYEGWRDMDAYMRDNKLETIEPQLPPVPPPGVKRKSAASEDAAGAKKTTEKAAEKH